MPVSSDTPANTGTYQSSANSTSHNVTFGFTPSKKSLVVLAIASGTAAPNAVPTGWISTSAPGGTQVDTSGVMYWKISDGTETSVTVTFAASQPCVATVLEFTGSGWRRVGSATTLSGGTSATTSGFVHTPPALNVVAVAWGAAVTASGWTNSYNERSDASTTGGTAISLSTATHVTAGTGETTTATLSGSANGVAMAIGFTNDGALPTTVSAYEWSSDSIQWIGPFISSNGSVYVLGGNTTFTAPTAYKAPDPTGTFVALPSSGGTYSYNGFSLQSLQASQSGDTLHVSWVASNTQSRKYATFDMSTDTWLANGSIVSAASGSITPVNQATACVKRSTGGDVIYFTNYTGVTTMGKTYGRVAAVRLAGGTTAGAATGVGIGLAATNQNTESVESVVLGASDRVHLFWTQTGASSLGSLFHRCVKSTDNLDGTSPATAAASIATVSGASSVELASRSSGQAFLDSSNNLHVSHSGTAAGSVQLKTAASADTPSWSSANVSASSILSTGRGNTSYCGALGGSPPDGTNKTVAWVDGATSDPMYDKDTGSGFGTDTAFQATTGSMISANVYQRDNSIVLAALYEASGAWVYDEVVLRTVVTQVARATPYPQMIGR